MKSIWWFHYDSKEDDFSYKKEKKKDLRRNHYVKNKEFINEEKAFKIAGFVNKSPLTCKLENK